MLSPKLIFCITKTIQDFTTIKMLPFSWNLRKGHLCVTQNWRTIIPVIIQLLANFVIVCPVFILGPLVCIQNTDASFLEILKVALQLACICCAGLLQINCNLYRHEASTFINILLEFERSQGKLLTYSIQFC